MIIWGHPTWLIALVVPVLLLVLELVLRVRAHRARRSFAADELWARLAPGRSTLLRRSKRYLFDIALIFLVIGLANPRVGTRYENVTRQGIDIMLVVDVSKSMDSQDIRPSRIEKTRYELAKFIEGMKGDRVGIVPFAGTAYPLMPLTLDYAAARMFLDLLSTDLIPTPGTAIADAINTALDAFPKDDKGRGKAIVLVSDGEDHEGDVKAAAERAGKEGVPIYTIGMALAKGDPIPVFNDQGTRTGWLTDDNGEVVTSRLNEDLLREIAEESGGSYHRATQGGDAFRAVYKQLFKLDRKDFETRRITGYEDRFQPLLILALVLLVLQFVLPGGLKRTSKRIRPVSTTATIVAAFALLALASPARADNAHQLVKQGNRDVVNGKTDQALTRYLEAKTTRDSANPVLNYDLGGAYARLGDAAKADSLWRSLPEDTKKELLSRAAYNRGTTFAQQKQYDKAIPSFIDALRLNPHDKDAKMNLELARQQLQQQKKQQQNQDKNKQNKNKDKKKQQQNQQNQKDQKNKKDQQQQQQDQKKQDQKKKNEQKKQQQQQQNQKDQKMKKEMAERLLDQMQQNEKKLLKQVIRQQIPQKKKSTGKPW